MKNTVILIPAYKPDNKLIETLEKLSEEDYALLVVDDGSGDAYDEIFIQAARYSRVIRYAVNRGKGGAMKQGMRCIKKCFPDAQYFITADADGQHKPEDIKKVSAYLLENGGFVIGCREFVGDVPFRSRFGNTITRGVYRMVSGVRVKDTQTGLRGFECSMIDWLLAVPGTRYEYEMNVLMSAARDGITIGEVGIQTIYENNNESSHFRPLQDSVKIYKEIFKFALSSHSDNH